MDAKAFRRMKRTAFLINVSRGELVDEIALEAALDADLIASAALDVGTADNQMPPARLARRDDVTATPHVGGLTAPAIWHQAAEMVEHVADILNGRLPRGAVNGSSAYRLSGGARQP
ncbi:NAD(P)-dependent oxidoreductase [Microvirga sp. G4-2]|uniref:NAD(P)-dependent oxidoreductase n=1 Tax=Microvirga sp. G4-2 TaxID=3434467 RepID=UPI004044D941